MTLKLFTVRPLSDLPPPDTFPSKFMQINCSAQADKHPATRQLGLRVRGMTELCISDSNFELMEPQDRKWNSCKILPWAGLGWAVITSATCKNSSRMAAGTSTGRAIMLLAGWRGPGRHSRGYSQGRSPSPSPAELYYSNISIFCYFSIIFLIRSVTDRR